MRIRVLGSAAGGGFPQWNCACPNCRGIRAGTIKAAPRREESVAINGGDGWLLLNASPDIRAQIESFPPLWPERARHTPIRAIALTSGDLDHVLGLFSLRESQPLTVLATPAVRRGITEHNAMVRTFERVPEQVRWIDLPLFESIPFGELSITAIPCPGKRPIHLEGIGEPSLEDNVGLLVRKGARCVAYFPAVADLSTMMDSAIAHAEVVFFDGTFWRSEELIALGVGTQRAEEMAHLPVRESLAYLGQVRGRRILIHVNNTNPVLREDSEERRVVESAGVEIAYDGMEMIL